MMTEGRLQRMLATFTLIGFACNFAFGVRPTTDIYNDTSLIGSALGGLPCAAERALQQAGDLRPYRRGLAVGNECVHHCGHDR
jgi:hypothetical protein